MSAAPDQMRKRKKKVRRGPRHPKPRELTEPRLILWSKPGLKRLRLLTSYMIRDGLARNMAETVRYSVDFVLSAYERRGVLIGSAAAPVATAVVDAVQAATEVTPRPKSDRPTK